MGANTFGNNFTLTTFGESHGEAVGGVIDGCPSGLLIDLNMIEEELQRRKTGTNSAMSQRKESDKVVFLSGIFEGKTLGTPIAFMVKNEDARSADYENIKDIYRPSHADFTYQQKYGIRDYRGGGRGSARTLLPCVVAGAIAKQILQQHDIVILSFVTQIGEERSDAFSSEEIVDILNKVKKENDTVGAVVRVEIDNMPIGIGEPHFRKLQAVLAQAMFSINAVKGFEYGEGFHAASMRGSECNDAFINIDGNIRTKTNHSGGIQGGISNGEKIYFNVAFKPIPTIMQSQKTVDVNGEEVVYDITGRHDVCVVPRVLPVVEAMTAIALVDFIR
ncbi:MAG: chorismate synthase [Bacteroidales bacterium]|nr:chorismate synthase [Bacteroidales bacterium]